MVSYHLFQFIQKLEHYHQQYPWLLSDSESDTETDNELMDVDSDKKLRAKHPEKRKEKKRSPQKKNNEQSSKKKNILLDYSQIDDSSKFNMILIQIHHILFPDKNPFLLSYSISSYNFSCAIFPSEPKNEAVVAKLRGYTHRGLDFNTLYGTLWLSDEVRKIFKISSHYTQLIS